MLEANTDRSYFMIGAVIVAALLIGIAVWLFNDNGIVADNIKDTLGSLFTTGNDAIDGIDPSVQTPSGQTP